MGKVNTLLFWKITSRACIEKKSNDGNLILEFIDIPVMAGRKPVENVQK